MFFVKNWKYYTQHGDTKTSINRDQRRVIAKSNNNDDKKKIEKQNDAKQRGKMVNALEQ